ncbi:MAG: hypothetical protein SCALA702_18400 [Melioribacteraceae bacterium]|nr:MAG: hypothetical protein SCALA702_18400 [Melioribacteraceae bacterium]
MKNKLVYLLLLNLPIFIGAQNLDSLYNKFLKFKTHDEQALLNKTAGTHFHEEKCGFGILASVAENFQSFTKEQQETITSLITRPQLDTSIVTPKGYFRIHFDTSNNLNNQPGYDVDSLAAVLDFVYDYETEVLGYPAAPGDNGEGGDELYDFYIQNQSPGYYGYTQPESMIANSRWRCYSVIDNDFKGYASAGLDGAKVTVAHEYHHAIQIGRYINKYTTEGYYYEISSVAMEEFVYDDINDYYNFMGSYFKNSHRMLSSNSGYNTGHWNMFLEQRFGQQILVRIWELMAEGNESLVAMSKAVMENGSNLKTEFSTFGVWNYFTGEHADPELYFEEGEHYPSITPWTTLNFDQPTNSNKNTINMETQPVSNLYIQVANQTNSDTLMAIITNADYFRGCCQNNYRSDISFTVQDYFEGGAISVGEDYYTLLESADIDVLAERTILNYNSETLNQVVIDDDLVFPQPFRYNKSYTSGNVLNIPSPESFTGVSELTIFTTGMDRVYSEILPVHKISHQGLNQLFVRNNYVVWDGLDNDGNKLPSGVYIYVTYADDEIKKGKLVIYHD